MLTFLHNVGYTMKNHFKEEYMGRSKNCKFIITLLVLFVVTTFILMLNACNDDNSKELTLHEEIAEISKSTLGDVVHFGKYQQKSKNDNKKDMIEWLVVDKSGNDVLLVSRYILDAKYIYPNTTSNSTLQIWSNSYIRNWLNSTFMKTAFSNDEITYISDTTISDADCGYSVDKVFLLSASQVRRYFNSADNRKAQATKYAIANGSGNDWWTRSKPEKGTQVALQLRFAYVNSDGEIGTDGYDCAAGYMDMGVRPAIWVSIK